MTYSEMMRTQQEQQYWQTQAMQDLNLNQLTSSNIHDNVSALQDAAHNFGDMLLRLGDMK